MTFSDTFSNLLSFASPIELLLLVNLISALSCLSIVLNSALDVNILYGSSVPLVIRSSIRTPIYASDLPSVNPESSLTNLWELIPAINPCAAASS